MNNIEVLSGIQKILNEWHEGTAANADVVRQVNKLMEART
ncbi:hypothetical protein M2428_000103 [Arthrobacter sp. ES3-54]|nr:hypothetical protein [Arthrobacter sp. ES3-54]